MFVKGEKKEKQQTQFASMDFDAKDKPLKCYFCKQNKLNHIVQETKPKEDEENDVNK